MASMPSCGQMSTTEVPRHTTRPSWRVSSVSLYWSSGSAQQERCGSKTAPRWLQTRRHGETDGGGVWALGLQGPKSKGASPYSRSPDMPPLSLK